MITVLIIVIVLLLLMLGAGTVVTVRRRDRDRRTTPPGGLPAGETPSETAHPARSPEPTRLRPPGRPGVPTRPPGRPAAAPTRPPRAPEAAPPAPAPPAPAVPPAPVPVEEAPAEEAPAEEAPEAREEVEAPPEAKAPRLRERVGRARAALGAPLGAIRRRGKVDEATFEELEEALLLADVGLATTERLLQPLRARVKDGSLAPEPGALLEALRGDAVALFVGEDRTLKLADEGMTVWLFVGVNGVGKTTTIGKVASAEQAAGRSVVLAAGDTFRAAAGEQLELWAGRSGAAIVRGAEGADPSSVVFDAIQHAAARSADLVLADTAGRLHTKVNLMEELRKVRRVADRRPGNVSEVLLVLDATTGQNGLVQARQFAEAAGVTGVVLTKLDGTAKGGIVLAIRAELGLPIKLAGIGEGVDDLVPFDPEEFVNALFE